MTKYLDVSLVTVFQLTAILLYYSIIYLQPFVCSLFSSGLDDVTFLSIVFIL